VNVITTDETARITERAAVLDVIYYYKRELVKLNKTHELDTVLDGLVSELKANWNLMDTERWWNAGVGNGQ